VRRIKLRLSGTTVLIASALVALAAWPAYLGVRSAGAATADPVAAMTPAPVKQDWKARDSVIAFLETRAGKNAQDMLTPRMLSAQYLQRYRERGDLGDVLRAEHAARVSLAAMPQRNAAGEVSLADAFVTLHRFREAKAAVAEARVSRPDDPGLIAEEAGIELELGDLDAVRAALAAHPNDPLFALTQARYDEETGHLADARAIVDRAMRLADTMYDTPAERRAWYHARAAELAFAAGDHDGARRDANDALAIFADHLRALTILARVNLADGRYADAIAAAQHAARLQPNPDVPGMLADAQAASGDAGAANATRDELFAVQRIASSQRVNDRLTALYEADHGIRLAEAYAIARRELLTRDDVYTDDTLAWAAARAGHWDAAREASRKALRYDTESAPMQYHAGVIAAHDGDGAQARRRFERALALDPHFAPVQADDARARLAALR
jgi:Flp pilus assembly protein TadD